MTKKALITGATGFLGRQVYHLFSTKGWTTVGCGWSQANATSIVKVDLSDGNDPSPQIYVASRSSTAFTLVEPCSCNACQLRVALYMKDLDTDVSQEMLCGHF